MNYLIALIFSAMLAGCSALPAPRAEDIHLYLLDAKPAINATPHHQTLMIGIPSARPGFDTPQMAYLRKPLELEYFTTHRWADTPARMLKPLLAQALQQRFSSVVLTPGIIPANLRLDTELIRLQQDFTSKPVKIQLTLRAQLIDIKDRRVIATRLFDEAENTDSDDAYGGVIAANRALQRVLDQLTEFCSNASTGQ